MVISVISGVISVISVISVNRVTGLSVWKGINSSLKKPSVIPREINNRK